LAIRIRRCASRRSSRFAPSEHNKLLCAAEADVRRSLCGPNPVAEEYTDPGTGIGPGAATNDFVFAGGGAFRVLIFALLVIAAVKPVGDPFGDVAGHIIKAEGIRKK